MSGWAITRTAAAPKTTSTGLMAAWISPFDPRRASRSAANRRMASLAISDGCTRNCPVPSHREDPRTETPSPGTSTTTRSAKASRAKGTAGLRQMR